MRVLLLFSFLVSNLSFSQETPTIKTDNDPFGAKLIKGDSLTAINRIAILDTNGTFYPTAENGNFVDENGKKIGIWTSTDFYIGDCTNSSSTSHSLYKNDSLLFAVIYRNDQNACYDMFNGPSITAIKYNLGYLRISTFDTRDSLNKHDLYSLMKEPKNQFGFFAPAGQLPNERLLKFVKDNYNRDTENDDNAKFILDSEFILGNYLRSKYDD